jgi:hypothetical protein
MKRKHGRHPDFWGREGRGGSEWSVVDNPPASPRGAELGGESFERPAVVPRQQSNEEAPASEQAGERTSRSERTKEEQP